jgi:hypothetical protein
MAPTGYVVVSASHLLNERVTWNSGSLWGDFVSLCFKQLKVPLSLSLYWSLFSWEMFEMEALTAFTTYS